MEELRKQKLGGAVILMENKVEYLVGSLPMDVRPMQAYSDDVIEFMDCFSRELRKRAAKMHLPDLISLAFWCRKANIIKLKEQAGGVCRMGRGLVFHITPSNVPVNFVFSYFFGLLSGNANIVRVPNKDFVQITEILSVLKKILTEERFQKIAGKTAFVRYAHEKEVTDWFSEMADCRMIWGGNQTINEIRKSPMKEKSTEIVFADRYSFGMLSTQAVIAASQQELRELAEKFYNDTYLMDQNACSTPHLLVWIGEQMQEAQSLFWDEVKKIVENYDLEPIKAVDKYTDLCMIAMNQDVKNATINQYKNRIYVWNLTDLPEDIDRLRGRYGMFYQIAYAKKEDFYRDATITSKVQTVLYYGIEPADIWSWIVDKELAGIDRIVPFGKSLDMNVYWDGYDIIGQLSRRIEIYE